MKKRKIDNVLDGIQAHVAQILDWTSEQDAKKEQYLFQDFKHNHDILLVADVFHPALSCLSNDQTHLSALRSA